MMHALKKDDPTLADLIQKEEKRIEDTLDLIAAENHASPSIMEALGSIFNTKTIEGYPGNRFHAGCIYADEVERLAVKRAQRLFSAPYVNVQPHSGTSANLAVYFSVLNVGDRVLAMSLPHGGHLSHGHSASITSKCFSFRHYTVDRQTEQIDYDRVKDMARSFRPRMIVAGASAYPRLIDYEAMADIAVKYNAYLLVDMAHLGGLVAGQAIPSPVPFSDFVTFTCYKTLMGGRGGVILARRKYGQRIDRAVFPGCQGTSAVNMIAAKALIFHRAAQPDFARLQQRTVDNARVLARALSDLGYRIVTGGTDNHQVLVDLHDQGHSGAQAETRLEAVGIVLNRNTVPRDADRRGTVGGIRIGTSAVTARKMGSREMTRIAAWIHEVLTAGDDSTPSKQIQAAVQTLCRQFPVYRR
jgi:glycine hydroxymethyltransferase